MAAQMPLHYPCTDVGGGTVSVQRGLLVAGTDGPGGQVIPAPMVWRDHLFPTWIVRRDRQ